MPKWNGGVIGVANNPTQSSAKGIWSLSEATKAIRAGLWPPSNAGADPYFENVTLLLPGDGTNGAQNNTFLDSSTNNFTITRNGNTTQGTFTPFSKADGRWAAFTNGSSQDVLITDNSAFQPGSGDVTYEAWVYPLSLPSASNYKTFWAQRSSAAAFGGVCPVVDSSGNLLLFVSNSTASGWELAGASTGITISTNQWQHISITRSGNTITPYKNGTAGTTSSVSTGAIGTSAGLSLMAGSYDGVQLVDGYMSNFRMVKGTAITPPAGGPTAPLSAVSGTGVLTLQSNRFIDNSGNNQTVTPVGGAQITTFSPFPTLTAYAAGTNGGSGYFDGSGDYLSVASNAAFQFGTGDFTVEAWWYPTTISSTYQTIAGVWVTGNLGWILQARSTDILITIGSGFFTVTGSATIVANQWYHVAASRSGTTVRVFLNGVLLNSGTSSASATGSTSLQIGRNEDGNQQYVNGYLSGTRLVKGGALYTATFTPPTSPPTTTVSSGTVSLLLNYTNAGIIDTSMSNDLETVGNAQISTTQSKFGGSSMYFDGTGDYLLMRDTQGLAFGTGDFTIEFWVYFNSGLSADIVLYDGRPTSTNGVYPIIYTNSSGKILWSTNSGDRITGTTTLTTGTWYHVAIARSGTSTKLFLNGTQEGSTYTDSNSYLIGSNRPSIGTSGYTLGNGPLNGYIDDLRITKGYARYTANFTAPISPFNGFGD